MSLTAFHYTIYGYFLNMLFCIVFLNYITACYIVLTCRRDCCGQKTDLATRLPATIFGQTVDVCFVVLVFGVFGFFGFLLLLLLLLLFLLSWFLCFISESFGNSRKWSTFQKLSNTVNIYGFFENRAAHGPDWKGLNMKLS